MHHTTSDSTFFAHSFKNPNDTTRSHEDSNGTLPQPSELPTDLGDYEDTELPPDLEYPPDAELTQNRELIEDRELFCDPNLLHTPKSTNELYDLQSLTTIRNRKRQQKNRRSVEIPNGGCYLIHEGSPGKICRISTNTKGYSHVDMCSYKYLVEKFVCEFFGIDSKEVSLMFEEMDNDNESRIFIPFSAAGIGCLETDKTYKVSAMQK